MLDFWNKDASTTITVSAIARVEMCSAIYRLRTENRMSSSEASSALGALTTELLQLNEQPVNPQVLTAASIMIERYGLRSLDAIQLGSAITSRDSSVNSEMQFITCDLKLLDAAQAEQLSVWDPSQLL